ncbi:MAG: PucR family transcriptional regulator [Solirubrobacterales bacterium]|nr:PucR family transcriptional regulator [Solirubrobacterales bacterium]HRV60063.1 helix-turn-helix domain-containing protein [Solirubrobacterales bacterium]
MSWPKPSERIAELIRLCVNRLLEDPDELFQSINEASIPPEVAGSGSDPVLLRTYRRVNQATLLQWAEANLREPGCEVPPYSGSEITALTRDLVRRGLDTNALEPYRAGQNITWQKWMEAAFEETDDLDELRELLEISARSIFAYVDATMMVSAERIQQQREEFNQTGAERLEMVVLVLEENPIDLEYAASRLNYGFDGTHLAAVIWSERNDDPEGLEAAAERLKRAAGAGNALTVHATSAALWAWVKPTRELAEIEAELEDGGEFRFALGTPLQGVEGFRQSHADASEVQRLVLRLGTDLEIARYDAMKVVALLTHDERRAARFVDETLGELAGAPMNLKDTVRTYLRNQSNATRTAEALFAHRNTILARIAKADEFLPLPLAESSFEVSAALEILHWQED